MKGHRFRLAVGVLLCGLLLLAGCGQKGRLTLPDTPPAQPASR